MKAENEEWKNIEFYEGLYQTNGTEVRSLDRDVFNPSTNKKMRLKGRILKPCKIVKSENYFKLSKSGVHNSLSISFIKFMSGL